MLKIFSTDESAALKAAIKRGDILQGDLEDTESQLKEMSAKYAQMKRERDALKAVPTSPHDDGTTPGTAAEPHSPLGAMLPSFLLSSPFFGTPATTSEERSSSPVPENTWRDSNNPGYEDADDDADDDAAKARIDELEAENQSLKERLAAAADKQDALLELLRAERERVKALQQQLDAARADVQASVPPPPPPLTELNAPPRASQGKEFLPSSLSPPPPSHRSFRL